MCDFNPKNIDLLSPVALIDGKYTCYSICTSKSLRDLPNNEIHNYYGDQYSYLGEGIIFSIRGIVQKEPHNIYHFWKLKSKPYRVYNNYNDLLSNLENYDNPNYNPEFLFYKNDEELHEKLKTNIDADEELRKFVLKFVQSIQDSNDNVDITDYLKLKDK